MTGRRPKPDWNREAINQTKARVQFLDRKTLKYRGEASSGKVSMENGPMRLADFISNHRESILTEWESFARSVWPRATVDPAELRDHAEEILCVTARDMVAPQTHRQQSEKSKGHGRDGVISRQMDSASEEHAAARVRSGLDLQTVVAEYRALRASVLRLWRESNPDPDTHDLEDITRFNESMDQSLTRAIRSFTELVDRSRQMFLAILGHDLRNPLNSILLSAQAISATGLPDPESAQMAAQITASATAMSRMIRDLLDFAGAALGGEMPVSPAPMDLEKLCRDVVDEMRSAYPAHTLHFESRGDLRGNWDAARLRQVISNLLDNAIHHGAREHPVRCTLSDDGKNVQLRIHSQGPPIPPEILPTIFEPLIRGSSPIPGKSRRPGSLGLGLYITRAVVRAHGGQIDVTSAEQEGTLFTASLPRSRR